MDSALIAVNRSYGKNRNDILKLIAIITMLIDHIGYIFFPKYSIFRTIGRIAFPIFAYLIAVGYKHTSSLSKYSLRLFCFALLSYLPFVYFNTDVEPNFISFNVMFLLLMGLWGIKIWDVSISSLRYYKKYGQSSYLLIGVITMLFFWFYMALPQILTFYFMKIKLPMNSATVDLHLSYGSYGLLLIMIFYWFENKPIVGIFSFIIMTFVTSYVSATYYLFDVAVIVSGSERLFVIYQNMLTKSGFILDNLIHNMGLSSLEYLFFQGRAIAGVILIYLLKDLPFNFKMPKYFAYVFYPLHITIILVIYIYLVK